MQTEEGNSEADSFVKQVRTYYNMLLGRVHTLSELDLENKVIQTVPAVLKDIKRKHTSVGAKICFSN